MTSYDPKNPSCEAFIMESSIQTKTSVPWGGGQKSKSWVAEISGGSQTEFGWRLADSLQNPLESLKWSGVLVRKKLKKWITPPENWDDNRNTTIWRCAVSGFTFVQMFFGWPRLVMKTRPKGSWTRGRVAVTENWNKFVEVNYPNLSTMNSFRFFSPCFVTAIKAT